LSKDYRQRLAFVVIIIIVIIIVIIFVFIFAIVVRFARFVQRLQQTVQIVNVACGTGDVLAVGVFRLLSRREEGRDRGQWHIRRVWNGRVQKTIGGAEIG